MVSMLVCALKLREVVELSPMSPTDPWKASRSSREREKREGRELRKRRVMKRVALHHGQCLSIAERVSEAQGAQRTVREQRSEQLHRKREVGQHPGRAGERWVSLRAKGFEKEVYFHICKF